MLTKGDVRGFFIRNIRFDGRESAGEPVIGCDARAAWKGAWG